MCRATRFSEISTKDEFRTDFLYHHGPIITLIIETGFGLLTHCPLGNGEIISQAYFPNSLYELVFWPFPMKLLSELCHDMASLGHNELKNIYTWCVLLHFCVLLKGGRQKVRGEYQTPWFIAIMVYCNKSSQRLPNTPICQHQWMPC